MGSSSKPKNYDLCHKGGKPGHFIKDCPLLKQEVSKYNSEKAAKRNPVPLKDFKRRRFVDNVVKQTLVACGDSSSESEDETDVGDSSMMSVESEENEYDSTFALMSQSDDDEENDNKDVTFRDVQRNLKSYTPKKLMSLANVLIDAYHNLVEDKDDLILELRETDKIRDDLVACVVDLKETIFELKREKDVLTKMIANLEHERDDFVVVVLDHKETIEKFSEEKEALARRVTEIEEERDYLLVEIADLGETMKGLRTKSKPGNTGKLKEIASEEHFRHENELKAMRTRMVQFTQKNRMVAENVTTKKGPGNGERKRSTMVHGYWKIGERKLLSSEQTNSEGPGLPMSKFKDQLGRFDAKSDEGIFLGYSSQSKAYKIYNKRTQCVEESVHIIFNESYQSYEKSAEEDQDREPLLVPGKVIDMTNGKADMMSQVKELSEDNTASSS
ncbi:uncharacterized protein [Nicotiana sylvestris]|uniref:uncharacterized protein n=1 Tax=Nicotiana sylvestris TaxID=4096 RepID=UPI00388C9312